MKKLIRYTTRIAGSLLLLLGLAWLSIGVYTLLNKDRLLKDAKAEIVRQVNGDWQIGRMDLSLLQHFPYISLQLSKVVLRDSGWQRHHHDLLEAEGISIRLSLFKGLFNRRPQADKIFLEQGAFYFFTDTAGYTNATVFDGPNKGKRNKKISPPDISLRNMRFIWEEQNKKCLYDLFVKQLDCRMRQEQRALDLQVNTSLHLNDCSFNTEKAPFLRDKEISGRFALQLNTASRILQGNRILFLLDGHPFHLSGRFFPDVRPDPFSLTLETSAIPYRLAAGLFPLHLREKLDDYAIDRPVSLTLIIDASLADKPKPMVTARLTVADKLFISYKGPFYQGDSIPAPVPENLDLDSLRWAPFKRNNR